MKKFLGDSCLPQCGLYEKMFFMIVNSDADCPPETYFDHKFQLLPEVAVPKEEYCASEVRHNRLKSFLWIYLLDAVTSSGILKAKQKLGVTFNSIS